MTAYAADAGTRVCTTHRSITNSLLAGGGCMICSCSNAYPSEPGTSALNLAGKELARCTGTRIKEDSDGDDDGNWYCATENRPAT